MNQRALVLFLLLGSLPACRDSRAKPPEEEAVHPASTQCDLSALLREVRLVFADTSRSGETGDLTGMVFILHRDSAKWTGRFAEATGQLGREREMARVEIAPSGAIQLAFPLDGDTARFDGMIACDRMQGIWQPFRGAVDSIKVFARVAPR